MAEVHIVDVGGEQWDMKDLPLTERVTTLEEETSVKDLQDLELDMTPEYTVSSKNFYNHYSAGKVHFINVDLRDLGGPGIGTYNTASIGSLNIRPKKETSFLLYDYKSRSILRCFINTSGIIGIGESEGVVSGDNAIFGELIFIEA